MGSVWIRRRDMPIPSLAWATAGSSTTPSPRRRSPTDDRDARERRERAPVEVTVPAGGRELDRLEHARHWRPRALLARLDVEDDDVVVGAGEAAARKRRLW